MSVNYLSRGQHMMDVSIGGGETVVGLSGARLQNVAVLAGGELHLSGGSSVSARVSSGGLMRIYQRGVARGGRVVRGGSQILHSGGTASGVAISSGGRQVVSAGGKTVAFSIYAGGSQTVMSGGSASNGRIYKGSRQVVYSGARVVSMRVMGMQTLQGGAQTIGMIISSGGSQVVGSHSVASGTTLLRGARQTVQGGGSAVGATVMAGATQVAYGDMDMATVSRSTVQAGASQLIVGGVSISARLRGRQYVSNGYARNDTIVSGGSQVIRRGGEANECLVSSGGRQILSSGALAVDCGILRGGLQIVSRGAEVYGVYIANGGTQRLLGGTVYRTSLGVGAVQEVGSGGSAFETLYRGGSQVILRGGVTDESVISSGTQILRSGGSARNTELSSLGRQIVSSGGVARSAYVHSGGRQIVMSGGSAVVTFMDGGIQTLSGGRAVSARLEYASQLVLSRGVSVSGRIMGGAQTLEYRGSSLRDVFSTGASQIISGGAVASRTGIYQNAVQVIHSGGRAWGAIMRNRGSQIVGSGANATLSYIRFGGSSIVSYGGRINSARVSSAGFLTLNPGASAANLIISSGGKMRLAGVAMFGGTNIFTGAVATGNGTLSLGSGATLRLRSANVLNLTINGPAATVYVTGSKNSVTGMNGTASMYFSIRSLSPALSPMISFNATAQQARSFGIFVNSGQRFGTYKLTRNMSVANGAGYTVSVSGEGSFSLRLNGSSFTRNGVSYAIRKSANDVQLTVSGVAGSMGRSMPVSATGNGDAAKKSSGTAKCDIFYGCGDGDSKIYGFGGSDVAVYDKAAWGNDVIDAGGGRMTVLFSGIQKSDITTAKSGNDMIIARKADTSQKITVRNWSSSTHKLVFGGTLGQFSKYMATASPTQALTTAARNEVWKKAGMLA